MGFVGRLIRSLSARWHSLCGWSAYRLGWMTPARRHFERVLVLRDGDFSAYVHLGRISFALGDYAGWRREFEHARRADPARFARLRHPFELFEPRLAGTDFDENGDRATWRSLRPFSTGGRATRSDSTPDLGDALQAAFDARAEAASQPTCDGETRLERAKDDCGTAAERRRFRELGPIAARDVARCDLDELARKLSG